MTPTAAALLGYTTWTILLIVALGILRVSIVLTRKKAPNSFNPNGEDLDGFGRRLTRAHANCYENLPIAGALLLYAIAADQTAITDGLAPALLAARVAQSVTHIASSSPMAINVRFGFFVMQIGILIFWTLKLAHLL